MNQIVGFQGQYRFLSNFWPVDVVYGDVTYPSVEHGYQAAKTCDPMVRNRIRAARTAGAAKLAGRGVPLRPDWEDVRLDVMRTLVAQKFQNPYLRDLLLGTGDAQLIEANQWGDSFWGVSGGRGLNHLGRILMDIRQALWPEVRL